jgi:hypothetical protein
MNRMIALFHENTPHLLDDIRGSIAVPPLSGRTTWLP